MFSYREVKLILYLLLGMGGASLIVYAWNYMHQAHDLVEGIVYIIPALILTASGIGMLVFAVDAFLLRDDADIWR